ncbi:hypothetical protein MBM09_12735 [Flaviramulus sp. BrNp1-15]|uniref:M56 family metallopeptidase n=1 Tax=Flaviramulus sp. BrNp1-15 TaxID=2916754 RepID=UPI001EE86AE5|nr:M56 family metallopeptidase [Flaviramulus sp. BrNp1-15]ULC58775.1 hypothetical protein MBM09_12735 [Flaviramulus sp. BrNp1-15]
MEYLLKVSAVVAIFYLSYKMFLQRDTFFKKNRWFLLAGLITAFLIPFYVIHEYIEYTPIDLSHLNFNEVAIQNTKNTFNVLDYFPAVYLLGIIFFSIRFLIQISSLATLIFKYKKYKKGQYTYVETNADVSPFSFFNWIVYNPNQFNKTELEQIIAHEKIHVQQYHSIDIILTQIACVLLWFNPFVWLYNKDLKQNLEFLADYDAVNYSACKKTYQYTLLKTSLPTHQLALSNNFYNSLIKKRIVMLHKSKSKKINQIKFALVLPLLAIFLMSFNTEKIYVEKEIPVIELLDTKPITENDNSTETLNTAIAEPVKKKAVSEVPTQTKKQNTIYKVAINDLVEVMVTKKSSDKNLDEIAAKLKEHGVTIKFKGVKRNNEGEITAIKINANSKNSNANYNISADDTIKPIKISFNKEDDSISIGNGHYIHEDGNTLHFISKDKNHKIHSTGHGNKVYVISDDDNDKNIEVIVESDVDIDTDVEIIESIEKNPGKNKAKIRILKKGDNDPIHIINGKVVEKNEVELLDKENIEKVEVLKGEVAIKKYGDKGKDGVVMVTTKKNKVNIISNDGKDPLYIIDGKEVKKDVFSDLNENDIKTMKVLKGDAAIEKYGKKGENGVIEITTKKKN